jgi:hypothetical protein
MKKAMLGILMALLFLGLPASPLSKRAFAQQAQDDGSTNEQNASDEDQGTDPDKIPDRLPLKPSQTNQQLPMTRISRPHR